MFSPSLLEPLTLEGFWTTPEADQGIPGTLTYDPIDGLHLRVFGPHEHIEAWGQEPKILHGVTIDGKSVTLFRLINHVPPFAWTEHTTTRLHAEWMTVGTHHFNSFEDLQFNSLGVSYFNLAEFLGQTAISETSQFSRSEDPSAPFATIELTQRQPEVFQLRDFAVEVGFDGGTFGDRFDRLGVFQQPWITATTAQPKHLSDFLRTVFYSVQTLLELSVQSWLPRVGIRAPSNHGGGYTYLFCHEHRPRTMPRRRPAPELLFTAQGLGESWPAYFERWDAIREKYLPTFLLYFSILRAPNMLLEFRFLNLVHALEAYHRRRVPAIPPSEDEQREKRIRENRVLAAVAKEDRGWLSAAIKDAKYAGQPHLKDRLAAVYETLPRDVRTVIGKQKTFAGSVSRTRNYLSHFDEGQRSGALRPDSMWRATEKLKLALKVVLMTELRSLSTRMRQPGLEFSE